MVLIKPLKYVLKLKHLVYIKFTISKCNLANVDICWYIGSPRTKEDTLHWFQPACLTCASDIIHESITQNICKNWIFFPEDWTLQ